MKRQLTHQEIGTWWAIRLTVDDLEIEKTQQLFEYATRYIISTEGDGDNTRIHHHIILVTEETSDQIKLRIREVYPTAKGNKCLYCKPSKDKTQLAKYTLKEGNYVYKGFTDKFIADTFKLSTNKTDRKKDLISLEEAYIMENLTSSQFLEQYILYKVKYDQPLYSNHIQAYMMKMMIRANKLSVQSYADSILAKCEMSVV